MAMKVRRLLLTVIRSQVAACDRSGGWQLGSERYCSHTTRNPKLQLRPDGEKSRAVSRPHLYGDLRRGVSRALAFVSLGEGRNVLGQDQDAIHGAIGLPHALYGKAGIEDSAVLAEEAMIRDVALDNASQHLPEMRLLAGQVVGMNEVRPCLVQEFRFRVTEHLADSLVDLDPISLRRQNCHAYQPLLEIPPEPLLAFQKPPFGFLAFGDLPNGRAVTHQEGAPGSGECHVQALLTVEVCVAA